MEQEQRDRVRLIDVMEALRKRDRGDEADELGTMVLLELVLFHGQDVKEVPYMKIADIVAIRNLPPRKGGWDNFYYGRAAFVDDHNG